MLRTSLAHAFITDCAYDSNAEERDKSDDYTSITFNMHGWSYRLSQQVSTVRWAAIS